MTQRKSPDRARAGAIGKSEKEIESRPSNTPATDLQVLEQESGGALRVRVVDMFDALACPKITVPMLRWIGRMQSDRLSCLTCDHVWVGSPGPPPPYFAIVTPARPDPHVHAVSGICWVCSFRDDLRDAVLKELRRQWPQARWAGHVHEPPEGKQ